MTEVLEMFLRRVVIEQRIPFDVVALSDAQLEQIAEEYEHQIRAPQIEKKAPSGRHRRIRSKRE